MQIITYIDHYWQCVRHGAAYLKRRAFEKTTISAYAGAAATAATVNPPWSHVIFVLLAIVALMPGPEDHSC